MNFLSDQEGIMKRYLRERENWDGHLQQCKNFIIQAFQDSSVRSVAVLGSGWLLDLPLEYLSERFEEVHLIDIHHPAQVRKKLESYTNVKTQAVDITGGGIEFAWDYAQSGYGQLDPSILSEFNPQTPDLESDPDAFISLNILNQLDILIVDFLKSRNPRFREHDFIPFRSSIQGFHVDWISQKPACLISDILEVNTDKRGKITTLELLHTTLPDSSRSEEWTWDFDLSGFYHRNKLTKMKVRALEW